LLANAKLSARLGAEVRRRLLAGPSVEAELLALPALRTGRAEPGA